MLIMHTTFVPACLWSLTERNVNEKLKEKIVIPCVERQQKSFYRDLQRDNSTDATNTTRCTSNQGSPTMEMNRRWNVLTLTRGFLAARLTYANPSEHESVNQLIMHIRIGHTRTTRHASQFHIICLIKSKVE